MKSKTARGIVAAAMLLAVFLLDWLDRVLSRTSAPLPAKASDFSDTRFLTFMGELDLAPLELPDNVTLTSSLRQTAHELLQSGKIAELIRVLEKSHADSPSVSLTIEIAKLNASLGNMDRALALLAPLELVEAADLKGAAHVYFAALQLDDAARLYAQTIEIEPDEVTFANLASVYHAQRDYASCLGTAQSGLGQFPASPYLHYCAGIGYVFEVRDNPSASKPRHLRKAAWHFKETIAATSVLRRIRVMALSNLGLCMDLLGHHPTALSYWTYAERYADEHGIRHSPLYLNLGNCQLLKPRQDLSAALDYYTKAIDAAKNNRDAYIAAGDVLRGLERFREAGSMYGEVFYKLDPTATPALEGLIICALCTFNFDAADKLIAETERGRIDANFPAAARQMREAFEDDSLSARLLLASFLHKGFRAPLAAAVQYERIRRVAPSDITLLVKIAEAYRHGRAHEECLKTAKTIVELQEDHFLAIYLAAEACRELGKMDEALNYYQRLSDASPESVLKYLHPMNYGHAQLVLVHLLQQACAADRASLVAEQYFLMAPAQRVKKVEQRLRRMIESDRRRTPETEE